MDLQRDTGTFSNTKEIPTDYDEDENTDEEEIMERIERRTENEPSLGTIDRKTFCNASSGKENTKNNFSTGEREYDSVSPDRAFVPFDEIKMKKASKDGEMNEVKFQLLNCEFDYRINSVVMKGRCKNGKSVGVKIKGSEHYFYLQRQRPFRDDDEISSFLRSLEKKYGLCERYTMAVPVGSASSRGRIMRTKRYGRNNDEAKLDDFKQITKFCHMTKKHKTLYGWTPPEERLDVVKVWVERAIMTKEYHRFLESPEYVASVDGDDREMMVRTWEASMDPSLRYRIDHGIKMGCWCSTNDYSFVSSKRGRSSFYSDLEITVDHDKLWCDESDRFVAPLRVLSYDIECAGKQMKGSGETRFPVARWNKSKIANFVTNTLGLESPKNSESWSAPTWQDWIRRRSCDSNSVEGRKAGMEFSLTDTDPVTILVAVVRTLGEDEDLRFSESHALVYTHPDAEPIDRSFGRDGGSTTRVEDGKTMDYSKIKLTEYDSEMALIYGFTDLVHSVGPDVLVDWNGTSFDLPYMWDRFKWIQRYGTKAEKALIERNGNSINFGLRKNDKSRCVVNYSREEKKGGKREKRYRKISTPFLIHDDGIVVWRHKTFGLPNEKWFNLDYVSGRYLRYPDTDFPMRKMQINISEGTARWKRGGKDLWYFVVYCFWDACLPVLLLETLGKFSLQMAIARATNVTLDDIYNKGIQMKLMSMLYGYCRNLYEGVYLVPDKGNRNLHWPGVFRRLKREGKDEGCLRRASKMSRLRPPPEGAKGYMGAKVFEPERGLHDEKIVVTDFVSLYPSIMKSYLLCYTNFLTKECIEAYDVGEHLCLRVVLGMAPNEGTVKSTGGIYCGDTEYDPESAREDGYFNSKVKVARWMQEERNVVGPMIKDLFEERLRAKSLLKNANECVRLLEDATSDAFPNVEEFPKEYREHALSISSAISDGETGSGRYELLAFKLSSLAKLDKKIYDNMQLSFKLILNSFYGFTVVPEKSAILPLMELGASVTSIGRREIKRAACITENLSVDKMLKSFSVADEERERSARKGKSSRILGKRKRGENSTDLSIDCKSLLKYPRYTVDRCRDNDVEGEKVDSFSVAYGDTDSIMVSLPKKKIKTVEMAERSSMYCSGMINYHMLGMMKIEHEKTSERSLLLERKKYAMKLSGEKDFLEKGIASKRRNTLPFAKRITKEISRRIFSPSRSSNGELESLKEAKENTVIWLKRELMDFANGRVDMHELIMSQRLNKAVYKSPPEHVGAANKRRARGEEVYVGSRIPYVFVQQNYDETYANNGRFKEVKGIDVTEDPKYALKHKLSLNLDRYWFKKVKKPIANFCRHIYAPMGGDYPRQIDEEMDFKERSETKKRQERAKGVQNARLDEILFQRVDQKFRTRKRIKYEETERKRSVGKKNVSLYGYWNVKPIVHLECDVCKEFFRGRKNEEGREEGKSFNVCNKCKKAKDAMQSLITEESTTYEKESERAWERCKKCVNLLRIPGFDPKDCKKFDCEVFQERSNADRNVRFRRKQLLVLASDW